MSREEKWMDEIPMETISVRDNPGMSAVQPQQTPEIEEWIGVLEDAIQELDVSIGTLADRIQPVCRAYESPAIKDPEPNVPVNTLVGKKIFQATVRIQELSKFLRMVTEACEV